MLGLDEQEKLIRKLRIDLDALNLKIKQVESSQVKTDQTVTSNLGNTVVNRTVSITDIDSTYDGTQIIHKLVHWFKTTLKVSANILPTVDITQDIGSSSPKLWFRRLYINQITQQAGTLANKPTGLTSAHADLLYYATDYDHTFRWNGTAWEFNHGEIKPGTFILSASDPGTGWHICDGTTVTRCKAAGDATTESVVLPDATGCFFKHGTYSATPVVAVPATLSDETDEESGHGHTMTGTTGASGDHDHAVSASGGDTGGPSGSTNVQSGSGASVASSGHTHGQGTVTGTAATAGSHSHDQGDDTGPGSAHKHGVSGITVGDESEPKHLTIPLYMRL